MMQLSRYFSSYIKLIRTAHEQCCPSWDLRLLCPQIDRERASADSSRNTAVPMSWALVLLCNKSCCAVFHYWPMRAWGNKGPNTTWPVLHSAYNMHPITVLQLTQETLPQSLQLQQDIDHRTVVRSSASEHRGTMGHSVTKLYLQFCAEMVIAFIYLYLCVFCGSVISSLSLPNSSHGKMCVWGERQIEQ